MVSTTKETPDDAFDLNTWYVPEPETKTSKKSKRSEGDDGKKKKKAKKDKKEKKGKRKSKIDDLSDLLETKEDDSDDEKEDVMIKIETHSDEESSEKEETRSKKETKKTETTASDESESEVEVKKEKSEEAREKKRTRKERKQEKKESAESKAGGMKQPKRTQFGIWIGNLSFKTTEAMIKHFFKSCGEIARVNLPLGDRKTATNKGFAYVDFITEEAMQAAIALSENNLEGRTVLIKNSKTFETTGRPVAANAPSTASRVREPSATLFLGNLSFTSSEESVREYYNDCEGLRKVRMANFEDSGKCKGFAYLDFDTTKNSAAALSKHPKPYFDGRLMRVEFAGQEATRRGAPWLHNKKNVTRRPEENKTSKGGESVETQERRKKRRNDEEHRDNDSFEKPRKKKGGIDSFDERALGAPNPHAPKVKDEIAQKPPSAAVVPFMGKKMVFTDDD